MPAALVLVASAACGRIGYEAVASGTLDAAAADASAGPAPEAGRTPDAADPPCTVPWPPGSRLLAEWAADGQATNEVPCSPWVAITRGSVPYGPGRAGQAWQFRSAQASREGDPNYLTVPGSRGAMLPQLTFDAWIRQIGFNAYSGSNRFIVSTSFRADFPEMGPGEAALYLHEIGEYFSFVKVGRAYRREVDWATCHFRMAEQNLPRDRWYRLTGTYDGASLSCYRDGVLMERTRLPADLRGPIPELVIGRNFPGDIDGVRVFDVALTAAQVARPWPGP